MWWGKKPKDTSAIVLSGGGTRGAYEAGVIHYIRTKLPAPLNEKWNFRIQVGSSVGAINAAFLAAKADQPLEQGLQLVKLWENIRTQDVYRRGPVTLGKLLARNLFSSTAHLLGLKGLVHPNDQSLQFRSLLDTEPFQRYLRRNCPFHRISVNIRSGLIDALAVSATNLHTGLIDIFVETQKHEPLNKPFTYTRISPRHVMASAALPVLFPPVPIKGVYYNDGGLRLKTPLTPAVNLGATRILVIATRSATEPSFYETPHTQAPGLGVILSTMFSALFLDRLAADEQHLAKINAILEACQSQVSERSFETICNQSQARPIRMLTIAPSIHISSLVDDQLRSSYRNLQTMGTLERSLMRLLEIDVEKGSDLLSYFMFEPNFIRALLDLGYQDAHKKRDELIEFAQDVVDT